MSNRTVCNMSKCLQQASSLYFSFSETIKDHQYKMHFRRSLCYKSGVVSSVFYSHFSSSFLLLNSQSLRPASPEFLSTWGQQRTTLLYLSGCLHQAAHVHTEQLRAALSFIWSRVSFHFAISVSCELVRGTSGSLAAKCSCVFSN